LQHCLAALRNARGPWPPHVAESRAEGKGSAAAPLRPLGAGKQAAVLQVWFPRRRLLVLVLLLRRRRRGGGGVRACSLSCLLLRCLRRRTNCCCCCCADCAYGGVGYI
jgi:hypothetical protein